MQRLREEFGERIAGLKDSSGNLDYAASIVAALAASFASFQATRPCCSKRARGEFAGCISASANVNPEFCARAFHAGDEEALATGSRESARWFRKNPLIPSVKAVLAHRLKDAAFEKVLPPLVELSEGDKHDLMRNVSPLLA